MGGPPLPPQRAGQQPSSFHQLIIFTNLQARKKVHSGLNNLGQEPCGKAEGTKAGHRRSRLEATSCLSPASALRTETPPHPLQPSDKGCPAAMTQRGSQCRPLPRLPGPWATHPIFSCWVLRPWHVLFLVTGTPFLVLHQGHRDKDRFLSQAVSGDLGRCDVGYLSALLSSSRGIGRWEGKQAVQVPGAPKAVLRGWA